MLGYVTIGALDSEAAGEFYDAVLDCIGDERKFAQNGWIGYGPKGEDSKYAFICPPYDKQPAKPGNGIMIAFKADTKEAVDAAHAAGLAHGGSDEGKPGYRPPDGTEFYGAYLRDPTGNKICVFCMG